MIDNTVYIIGINDSSEILHSTKFADIFKKATFVAGRKETISSLLPNFSKSITQLYFDDGYTKFLRTLSTLKETGIIFAAGDPGFFGVTRSIAQVIDPNRLEIIPAQNSVSLAFALIKDSWEDAVVVSTLGRDTREVINLVQAHNKTAILTSAQFNTTDLGKALLSCSDINNHTFAKIYIASELGSRNNLVKTDLNHLAKDKFYSRAVVILIKNDVSTKSLAFYSPSPDKNNSMTLGREIDHFKAKKGMITKPEIRSFAIGKLCLKPKDVLWDIGSASGSIAIESSLLVPGLMVYAIEKDDEAFNNLNYNIGIFNADVTSVHGDATSVLRDLPAPDSIVFSGGGIEVFKHGFSFLKSGGHAVGLFASLNRACQAADILGNMTQIVANRGERLKDGSWRLCGSNPVFVVWGIKE